GSADKRIRLYDAATGVVFRTLSGHGLEVTALAFSPDGTRLASAAADQTVHLWELGTSEPSRLLGGEKGAHDDAVWSAVYSPNNEYILTAGRDKLVKLWDARTGAELKTFKGHTSAVT